MGFASRFDGAGAKLSSLFVSGEAEPPVFLLPSNFDSVAPASCIRVDAPGRENITIDAAFQGYVQKYKAESRRITKVSKEGIPLLPHTTKEGITFDAEQFREYYQALGQVEDEEKKKFAASALYLLAQVDKLGLSPEFKEAVYNNIGQTHHPEAIEKAALVVDLMLALGLTGEYGDEVLKGAHVAIRDGGLLRSAITGGLRTSSHSHNDKMRRKSSFFDLSFRVKGIFSEIVVGTRKSRNYSWLQMEKTPLFPKGEPLFSKIAESVKHERDYKKHKDLGMNIGPYGNSKYQDKNPLVVHFSPQSTNAFFSSKGKHDEGKFRDRFIELPYTFVSEALDGEAYGRIIERLEEMRIMVQARTHDDPLKVGEGLKRSVKYIMQSEEQGHGR